MSLETDVELCSVTNAKAKEKLMNALMKAGVPYAEKWERVSLHRRRHYNHAKEICIIITHRAKADLARAVIEEMGEDIKESVVW
ncbi:MAG: hypothetical protein HFJ05_11795 [Eubacterium sp.]|nr:hypothetical protein [Eubacterium sp.]